MGTISASSIPAGNVTAADVYDADGKTFNPANPADSLEVLNGDMQQANYSGADATLPLWACQLGTFATGFYSGFDTWEFAYAKLIVNDTGTGGATEDLRVIHATLTSNYFLPWKAGVLFFGFQAFFRQDATQWDSDGTPKREFWDWRFSMDGTIFSGLYGKLPAARTTTCLPTDDPDTKDWVDPGDANENRWRWISKTGMKKSGSALDRGNHRLKLSVWANIEAPDAKIAKLLVPTGGIWLLALR